MDISQIATSINSVWVLVASFLVFFMQPGFLMLEAGQVRSKNVASVTLKNLFDWVVGLLVFFVVGAGIANVVGAVTSPGAVSLAESFGYVTAPGDWISWFFGAVFAMTAATIVSGAVAGRIKFKAYAIYSVVLTMVIYPVVVGLTWQGGLLAEGGYLGQVLGAGYLDFAGGTIVHTVGGVAGLTAASLLGPRQDRFDEDGQSNAIPGHSVLFAVLGTLFLAFGWFGFNVGTQVTVLTEEGQFLGPALGRVVLVTALGMAAGGVASSVVTLYHEESLHPLATADGVLAGLVAVTSGAAHITWWGGLLVGGVGGGLAYFAFQWTTETLRIDDVCGVFAIHGVAGIVGVLLLPFVGYAGGGWTFLGLGQLAMQVVGITVIVGWTVGTSYAVLWLLDDQVGLHVERDAEQPGLDKAKHNIVAYPDFATDGGVEVAAGGSSMGPERPDEPTMWRGEEVETDETPAVLTDAGLESFPNPTFVVDEDNEITALNPRAQRFFQTTEDDAVERSPERLVTDSENTLSATAEVLETRQEVRDRAGTVTVGGETVPIAVTVTPLHEEGQLVGALATIRNTADEVATVRHRQTVDEYRDSGLATQQEKLAALAAGDLDLTAGVPEPPKEHPDLDQLQATFREIDDAILEIADNIRAIVERAPEQSAELDDTSTTLSTASTEMQESIADISDLAAEIEARVANLSDKTVQSREGVEELSTAIEEITASTNQISSTAGDATEMTETCVGEMVETVDHMRDATAKTTEVSEAIADLEASMQEVADITTIIQDIAKKTDMLAINASIEAANASDTGDGFAVVAEEVKSLAEETDTSAKEIESLIESAREQTDAVASVVEETTETITAGADVVETTAGDLETVQHRIEETSDGITEIAESVDRQAENTQQISEAMRAIEGDVDDIDTLTTDISTNVTDQTGEIDRLTQLASELSSIATEMHKSIDTFDLDPAR